MSNATLTLERLEQHLDTDNLEHIQHQDEPWQISGMKEAAWAARKAKHAHDAIRTIDEWEEQEIARVRAAANIERAREQSTLEFFTGALAQYLSQLIESGERSVKTLNLPSGKISIRARQPALALDDDAALAWAKANAPTVVRVKESLDKTGFKKRIELVDGGTVVDPETGEVLDFCRWEPQTDSASFTPLEEDA